ncbi:polyketide cyclase / dehydrase and lipid transport [Millisia brevis]|uniref:polyketide cyclase / dehydrase and lipid transport n=1 Tax=Millisia brevis TaxID=264148 RepID=UPI000830C675|nr:polyketide cyclase / dehydrase and lipid transport [Millisia brevis]
MSTIQIADQTFVAAPAAAVAAYVADRSRWARWWPDLVLSVREDRGPAGIRWSVGGALDGTMEVWLEPILDGVIFHYFVHAEPAAPLADPVADVRRRRIAGKRVSFGAKRILEDGRAAGEPAAVG